MKSSPFLLPWCMIGIFGKKWNDTLMIPPSLASATANSSWISFDAIFFSIFFKDFDILPSTAAVAALFNKKRKNQHRDTKRSQLNRTSLTFIDGEMEIELSSNNSNVFSQMTGSLSLASLAFQTCIVHWNSNTPF